MSSLSFHYLSMAVHSTIQKNFMEQVKSSGLTSGQPKVLDYLRDHNGANQKEIAAACHIEPGHSPPYLIAWKKRDSLSDACWRAIAGRFISL